MSASVEAQFDPWSQKEDYGAYITHSGDHKYCLCEVTASETGKVEYHIVSMPLDYHSMIISAYENRLGDSFAIEILGGGILTIDRDAKTIRTYGQSGGYGPPRIEFVKRVLQESMKEYDLDITVSDYIRG